MRSTAVVLMIITVVSKIVGLLREIVLAHFYGTTNVSDAYVVATSIPVMVMGLIANGITTSFIPVYSGILNSKGKAAADRYTSNLANIVLIFATITVIIGEIFTVPLVKIFAQGFTGETLDLAVRLTRWSLLSVYAIGLSAIYRGYLNVNGEYVIPTSTGFLLNVILISSIVLSGRRSTVILGIGLFLANTLQYIIFIPRMRELNYRHSKVLDWKDEHIQELIAVSLPVMFSVAIQEINVLIDRTIASGVVVGGISALNYANKMIGFVTGIVIVSITTAIYPVMSKMASQGDRQGLRGTVTEAISMTNLLVIPSTVGLMVLAKPIITIVFARGEFDATAVELTSSALFFYAPVLIGYGIRDICNRAFYSLKDMRTPMYNAIVMVLINVVLDIVLARVMGIGGLALATSIASTYGCLSIMISFRRKIGPYSLKKLTISFVKITVAAAVMGAVAWFGFYELSARLGNTMGLAASIVAAAGTYGILLLVLRVDEGKALIGMLRRRLSLRNRLSGE